MPTDTDNPINQNPTAPKPAPKAGPAPASPGGPGSVGSGGVSSADPKALLGFKSWADHDRPEILTQCDIALSAYDYFVSRSKDRAATTAPPIEALRRLLFTMIEFDRWVANVSEWFRMADEPSRTNSPAERRRFAELYEKVWGKPIVDKTGVKHYPMWNPLAALPGGPFSDAGYGLGCTSALTLDSSIIGPDGKSYPVIVPKDKPPTSANPSFNAVELNGHPGGAPDDGRVWTTTGSSMVVVSDDPGFFGKAATAIAFGSGYKPINGTALAKGDQQDSLIVDEQGNPSLSKTSKVTTYGTQTSLASTVQPGKKANGTEGGVYLAEMVVAGAGGWAAAANAETGTIYTRFQEDGQGNRRVVVTGYQVRADSGGNLTVYAKYWDGKQWVAFQRT